MVLGGAGCPDYASARSGKASRNQRVGIKTVKRKKIERDDHRSALVNTGVADRPSRFRHKNTTEEGGSGWS